MIKPYVVITYCEVILREIDDLHSVHSQLYTCLETHIGEIEIIERLYLCMYSETLTVVSLAAEL